MLSTALIYRRSFILPLLFLFMCCLYPPYIYADGGAPQLAYVAGASQGIGVIDIARQRVTKTIAVAGDPHAILLSLDGHALYITQPVLGRFTVLMAKTGKVLCTANLPGQPSLLALSLDASTLYVAGQGDTSVRALDPTNCHVQRTFDTHESIYGVAVAASTAPDATPSTPNQLWVVGSTSLTVFDVSGHLLGTVAIPGGPQNISIPGGFTAYVTTRQGTVVAVDLNTRHTFRTLLTNGKFGPMDYDATTGEVYVPDLLHNQLDVLVPITLSTAATPHEPARIVQLDNSPQSIAITVDGQLGFVALSNGHTTMLDIPGHRTITNIPVGGTPHFIITGLYPPANAAISPAKKTISSSTPISIIVLFVLLGAVVLATLLLFSRRVRLHTRKPRLREGKR